MTRKYNNRNVSSRSIDEINPEYFTLPKSELKRIIPVGKKGMRSTICYFPSPSLPKPWLFAGINFTPASILALFGKTRCDIYWMTLWDEVFYW